MITTPEKPQQTEQHDNQKSPVQEVKQVAEQVEEKAKPAEKRFAPLLAFWQKINNDLIFNWSAMLAYTLIISLFPIFLVILAIAGFILGAIAPETLTHLENSLAAGLPGGASGTGGVIVKSVLNQLHRSAGIFLIVGIVGAIISGSGLFLSLESVFDIVYRLPGRDVVHQRIMAVGMMLIFVLLVPVMVLASVAPPAVLNFLGIGTNNAVSAFFIQVCGLVLALASACVFFGLIYFLVPNRPMKLHEIWKGTLLTAGLLVLYELVFPIYENLFLHPNSYGSLVGFAIVILTFLYYLAFILILGAEVNAMVIGIRPTTKPLNTVLHELELRGLMIDPPVGQDTSAEPPTNTESPERSQQQKTDGARPINKDLSTDGRNVPQTTQMTQTTQLPMQLPQSGLTRRQQVTIGAVAVAGTIAIAPIVRFTKRLMLG